MSTVRSGLAVVWSLVLLLASLAVAVLPAEASSHVRARTPHETAAENELFARHNTARQNPGQFGYPSIPTVPTLTWAEDLAQIARAWSDQMASSGALGHDPSHRHPENVGWVLDDSRSGLEAALANAVKAFQSYMDSRPHRENIVNSRYVEVGIGVSITGNDHYSTVVFRERSSGTTPTTPTTPPSPPPPVPSLLDIAGVCPADPASSRFIDVTRHIRAIDCLAERGLASGVSSNRFAPSQPVTRAHMATFIANAIIEAGGSLPPPAAGTFTDVPASNPHAANIRRLAAAGIVRGVTTTSYRPSQPVTRAQMARFLMAAKSHVDGAEPAPPTQSWFTDVKSGTTFYTDIGQAADAGIAAGFGNGRYGPSQSVRRDQMASFIARWLAAVS